MREVDVAIVGGGPAGLTTAIHAARAGVESIHLFNAKGAWGVPVQCAEFVPALITQVVEIPDEAIVARTSHIALYLNNRLLRKIAAPGFVLHRHILEHHLAEQAASLGVVCHQGTTVETVEEGKLRAGGEEYSARIIAGCDGPRSVVRRAMGLPPNALASGLQYVLRDGGNLGGDAEIYFSPRYGAGYAWCFPKGQFVNVGLALDFDRRGRLGGFLDEFTSRLVRKGKLPSGVVMRRTGGLIPVGGAPPETVRGNMLLVGDAAGQTNPLTGAGIYNAVACGKIAGEVIAKAVKTDDLSLLGEYETEWRDLLHDSLRRALNARRTLERASIRDYESILRKAWKV